MQADFVLALACCHYSIFVIFSFDLYIFNKNTMCIYFLKIWIIMPIISDCFTPGTGQQILPMKNAFCISLLRFHCFNALLNHHGTKEVPLPYFKITAHGRAKYITQKPRTLEQCTITLAPAKVFKPLLLHNIFFIYSNIKQKTYTYLGNSI